MGRSGRRRRREDASSVSSEIGVAGGRQSPFPSAKTRGGEAVGQTGLREEGMEGGMRNIKSSMTEGELGSRSCDAPSEDENK